MVDDPNKLVTQSKKPPPSATSSSTLPSLGSALLSQSAGADSLVAVSDHHATSNRYAPPASNSWCSAQSVPSRNDSHWPLPPKSLPPSLARTSTTTASDDGDDLEQLRMLICWAKHPLPCLLQETQTPDPSSGHAQQLHETGKQPIVSVTAFCSN